MALSSHVLAFLGVTDVSSPWWGLCSPFLHSRWWLAWAWCADFWPVADGATCSLSHYIVKPRLPGATGVLLGSQRWGEAQSTVARLLATAGYTLGSLGRQPA